MAKTASQTSPYEQIAAAALRGSRATAISIVASAALAAIKILSGVIGNSHALIADGVESILDIFSSLVVLGSLRLAATPPTQRYPFGYGRVEPLGALVVSLVLLAVAVGIAIESVREILTPHHAPAKFTLAVLIGVVLVKELMFRRLERMGTKISSTAIRSDAWHHRSDALTSVAAFIGISIALVGGEGYESADAWAALAACLVIAFNGVHLLRVALAEVLDVAAPEKIENRVRAVALEVPGVSSIDKCRVRKSGLGYFVEIHVVVDGDMSVREGHEIAHLVKDALTAEDLGILDVTVHIEPA
jgi:cation diffusion facilitator family transporter